MGHNLKIGDLIRVPDEDGYGPSWRGQLAVVVDTYDADGWVRIKRLHDGYMARTWGPRAEEKWLYKEEQADGDM